MNQEIRLRYPVAAIFTKPRFYPGVAPRMAAGRVFPKFSQGAASLLNI
jgi:hypothetical protein